MRARSAAIGSYLDAHGTSKLHVIGLIAILIPGVTYIRPLRQIISKFISPVGKSHIVIVT